MKYRFNERPKRRWPLIVTIIALAACTLAVALWLWLPRDPVPQGIKQAVGFPVYYPVQAKLPQGYTLDTLSFSASEQAVMYTVSYGSNQKLVVTVQKRPTDEDLAVFYKQTIPVNRKVLTMSGEAAVGAIAQQTIASLPTTDRSWLIVMGPADINRDELSHVLQAMTKAN